MFDYSSFFLFFLSCHTTSDNRKNPLIGKEEGLGEKEIRGRKQARETGIRKHTA